jgi:deoxyribodipyrimidine photolyase
MLSIILFIICFCLASIALYEPEAEVTNIDNFENFYSAIKEILAPESEVIAESLQSQTETRKTKFITDKFELITSGEVDKSDPSSQFTIRQLREYVRQRNLQTLIKEQLGKSVNNCRKEELLSVLFA